MKTQHVLPKTALRTGLTLARVVPMAALVWTCTADSRGPTAPEVDSGAPARAGTSAGTTSLDALVADGFDRMITEGWGEVDTGGIWRIDSHMLSAFSVSESTGRITKFDNSPRNAVASEGYGLDVTGLAAFSIDVMPDRPNRYFTVQVYARRDDRVTDGDFFYRFRIRAYGNGKMDVRVEKTVNGHDTWLTSDRKLDFSFAAGQRYWIRWESTGTSPSTTLRMRVWPDGMDEPAGWDIDTTVDEPALDVPGTTGVRVSGPNGSEQVSWPVTFSFDELFYGTPSASEPPPPENQAPVANAGGPYSGVLGGAVQFDGSGSSDPDGDTLIYAWDFGDGATGTGATPTHTYAAADTFTVRLVVTDSRGLSSEAATTTVTITEAPNQAPVADAGGPYSGTAGSAIAFDGTASSDPDGDTPLTYSWDFGDGATGTGATTAHTYSSSGTFTVTLVVTDARGTSGEPATTSAVITEAPNEAPVADAGGPYAGNTGSAIDFDGTGSSDPDGDLPLTYSWDFGDGSTGTGATPSHAYDEAGQYTVTLVVSDSRRGLSAPSTSMVDVDAAPVSSTLLVADDFGRTVSNGWGSADVGGLWRIDSHRLGDFSTNGSQGLITKSDYYPRNAIATNGYGLNVRGVISFSIDTPVDYPNRYYTVQVYARRDDRVNDGDDYYRYRVRLFGDGGMDVRVEKNVRATSAWLSENIPVPTTFVPGRKYWIRWESVGTSPSTRVRMRVWADGEQEPSGWAIDVTVDEPALDVVGTTGVRVSGPNGDEQTTYPVTFAFDDLEYAEIPQ